MYRLSQNACDMVCIENNIFVLHFSLLRLISSMQIQANKGFDVYLSKICYLETRLHEGSAVVQVFDLYHNLYGSHDISLQPQDTLISVDYLTHYSSYALAVWGKIFPCLHMFIHFYHAFLSLVHYDFRAYPISTRSVLWCT